MKGRLFIFVVNECMYVWRSSPYVYVIFKKKIVQRKVASVAMKVHGCERLN